VYYLLNANNRVIAAQDEEEDNDRNLTKKTVAAVREAHLAGKIRYICI
jgi:hypothetical protein